MKTTMRDAVVNCRPTKMQKNSAPNSAPASRPPLSVPSRANSAMPRRPAQSQTRIAAPAERSVACQSGRNLRQRRLRGDLVQAPEEAAEDEDGDGEGVEMSACARGIASPCSAGLAPSPLRSPPSEREGRTPSESLFAPSSDGQAHRRFDKQRPPSRRRRGRWRGRTARWRCPSRRDGAAAGPRALRSRP